MSKEERLALIQEMESILNNTSALLSQAEAVLTQWQALLPDIKRMQEYYYDEQYLLDVKASEQIDYIPSGMPHGILSEDAAYNVLAEQHQIALGYLKLISEVLSDE